MCGLLALLRLLLPLGLQELEILLIGHRPPQSSQEFLQGLEKTIARRRLVRIDGLQQPLDVGAEAKGVTPDALDPLGKAGRLLESGEQIGRLGHDFVDGDR